MSGMGCRTISVLVEVLEHGIDHLECLVNFLAHFGAGEDNLAAHENEEYNLGLDHAIDEAEEHQILVYRTEPMHEEHTQGTAPVRRN